MNREEAEVEFGNRRWMTRMYVALGPPLCYNVSCFRMIKATITTVQRLASTCTRKVSAWEFHDLVTISRPPQASNSRLAVAQKVHAT